MNADRLQDVRPQLRQHEVFDTLAADYAGDDPSRWRALAILYLRCVCNWEIAAIRLAFRLEPGEVPFIIRTTADQIRDKFGVDWGSFEHDEDGEDSDE